MSKIGLALTAGCLVQLLSAATVQFQVTPLGSNKYRDTYTISGFPFQANQELDILFDPALYSTLMNGQAPAGFDLLLFQPNNPPGAPGDYSALAIVNNPSLNGIFSVDFTFLGTGQPGSQPFTISQLDGNGNVLQPPLDQGNTTPFSTGGVPEPSSFALAGLGVLFGGIWRAVRQRRHLA